jgi:hypothetical protein
MSELKLPPLTQEPIQHVDATPDEDYPLRILRAYRANCDCQWASTSDGAMNALCEMMNRTCEERAAILDRAIARLEAKA